MNRPFSVYIIDWKIPDINSMEVICQLRQSIGSQVPVYILTAYDYSDIEEEAKKAGVTGFCQKPLFLSQLRAALLEHLGENVKCQNGPESMPNEIFRKKRILLVEDNELNREIAEEILTEAGFSIDTAEDGKIAVDKITSADQGAYDLILMDIQMPIMDGYEATKVIRAMPFDWIKKLPILAMTANAFEEDRKNALAAGMNGHLTKPIDTDKLFKALAKHLQ